MNMIEKLARAFAKTYYPEKDADVMWKHMVPEARAAINEMMNPTPDMCLYAHDATGLGMPKCKNVFKLMIEAAEELK